MGFSYIQTNKTKVDSLVNQIMDFYSLIMITEYMEESLILMAYELNWNIEDIRFFSGSWICIIKYNHLIRYSKNFEEKFYVFLVIVMLYIIILCVVNPTQVNKNANKDAVRDESLVEKVNEWSMADKSLYDRANATFWRKVDQFGFERMKIAKEKLIAMNNELYDYCVDQIISINRTDLMKKASLAKLSPDDPRFVFFLMPHSKHFFVYGEIKEIFEDLLKFII